MRQRASLVEKLCYGFGGGSYTTEMAVVNSFLLLFYTDVMGLSAAAVGTVILVGKILDAVTDLLIFNLTDATRTKFGRYRPWLLMSIPLAVSFVLMFWYPDFLHTYRQKLIYCWILYILTIPVFETGYMCPLITMSATMSLNEEDRMGFVTARSVGESCGDLLTAFIVMPVILSFGTSYTDIRGWRVMVLIMGSAVITFGLIAFLGCRERYFAPNVDESGRRINLLSKASTLKGNKLFWRMFVLQFGFNIEVSASTMLFSYYTIYCIGREDWLSYFMIFVTATQILVTVLVPRFTQRFEKRRLIYTGCILCALSWPLLFYAKSFAAVALCCVLRGASGGLLVVSIWSSWPDVCDYTEWKYKKSVPGIIMAIANCGNKVAIGVSSYGLTAALTLIGYKEGAAVQTASTIGSIRWLIVGFPCVGVAMILAMTLLIPEIDRRNMEKLHAELDSSRNGQSENAM